MTSSVEEPLLQCKKMAVPVKIGRFKFDLKLITVEPYLFLYMFCVFLQFITFQDLVYQKVCSMTYNTTVCKNLQNESFKVEEDHVQKTSSKWILYCNLAQGIPSLFVLMFFLGPWGDRKGKKIPLLLPLIGTFLNSINNFLNSYYMSAPLGYLIIGNVLNGLTGGFLTVIMAGFSYITCVSSFENKTIRIGVLQAMTFLSGTIGTSVSGVMLDHTSFKFVFGLIAAIILLDFVYTIFWVDDVKPERPQVPSSLCRDICLEPSKDIWTCAHKKRKSKHFWNLVIICAVIFFLMLVSIGESDILLLYTKHPPLNWSQTTLGLFKGVESFMRGAAVVTLLPVMKKVFHTRDSSLALAGLVFKICALVIIGIGKHTWLMFCAAILGLLEGFPAAGLRSLASSMVDRDEQAKLFSIIGALEAIGQLLATVIFNNMYSRTLDFYAGFPYFVAAGFVVFCFFITGILHHTIIKAEKRAYETLVDPTEIDVEEEPSDLSQPDALHGQSALEVNGTII